MELRLQYYREARTLRERKWDKTGWFHVLTDLDLTAEALIGKYNTEEPSYYVYRLDNNHRKWELELSLPARIGLISPSTERKQWTGPPLAHKTVVYETYFAVVKK